MTAEPYFAPGDWNAVCDRCGRRFKASQMRKTWQGYYVCERDWEPRHPQDFVRARQEHIVPPWVRPPIEPFVYPGPRLGTTPALFLPPQLHPGMFGQQRDFPNGGFVRNPVAVDPYYDYTRLILRGQGANNSTTFIDDSPLANTPTAVGDSRISTDTSLPGFGGTSIFIDSGYLNGIPTAVGVIGTTAFTAEAWYYLNTTFGTGLMSQRSASPFGWALQADSFRAKIDGVWSDAQLVPVGPVVGAWTHVAVTHDGAGLYTYWRNGVAEDTATFATGLLDYIGSSSFVVGASSDAGESALDGYLYARLTVGISRYNAPFTPPTDFPASA